MGKKPPATRERENQVDHGAKRMKYTKVDDAEPMDFADELRQVKDNLVPIPPGSMVKDEPDPGFIRLKELSDNCLKQENDRRARGWTAFISVLHEAIHKSFSIKKEDAIFALDIPRSDVNEAIMILDDLVASGLLRIDGDRFSLTEAGTAWIKELVEAKK